MVGLVVEENKKHVLCIQTTRVWTFLPLRVGLPSNILRELVRYGEVRAPLFGLLVYFFLQRYRPDPGNANRYSLS